MLDGSVSDSGQEGCFEPLSSGAFYTSKCEMSQAWKNLERQTAKALKGKRILRLTAPGPSYISASDVELHALPWLKIDAKYRTRWAHHRFLEAIRAKYCRGRKDEPVLVTKQHRQRGACVTIRLEFFGRLCGLLKTNR